MKTTCLVIALALVGSLLGMGAHRRAEGVRAADRIAKKSAELASVRNENAWLRARILRGKTPAALEVAAAKAHLERSAGPVELVYHVDRVPEPGQ